MSSHAHVVVGLGETGRSVARYLAAEDIPFIVGEDHPTAAAITEMKQLSNPPSILPISDVPMQNWDYSDKRRGAVFEACQSTSCRHHRFKWQDDCDLLSCSSSQKPAFLCSGGG